MRLILCLVFLGYLIPQLEAQLGAGCTDPQADNFDSTAIWNDGSCLYSPVQLSPQASFNLDPILEETSGLIFWQDKLWTHNDGAWDTLYALDTLDGSLISRQALPAGIPLRDWEDLGQDEDYIYIGDFGNNSGTRRDLRLYRYPTADINGTWDTLRFAYEDQDSFNTALNANAYDCEAMVISGDTIYLFSKRWTDNRSFVYALAKDGSQDTARLVDSFEVQGLVSSAWMLGDSLLVLSAYTPLLQPYLWLCYDFQPGRFFSGNKRRINLNLSFHQVEALCSADGLKYYLSNERFQQGSFINIPAKLQILDLSSYLSHYLYPPNSPIMGIGAWSGGATLIYPNPSPSGLFFLDLAEQPYALSDALGRPLAAGLLQQGQLDLSTYPSGVYLLHLPKQDQTYRLYR